MQNNIDLKSDRGFTLLELMVVLFMIGIIAAIASPNFIGLLGRIKVSASLEQLLGAIRETQRQAMRQSKSCRVNIYPGNNTITATPNDCLLNDRQIDSHVTIRSNFPGSNPNISFSHKGNTTRMGTIVLSSDLTDFQQCFVISLGLGIMRTGDYTGSKTGRISGKNCLSK